MSQMPIGPSVEAPAPCSPGLAEAGGEYGCGTAESGQRGRGQAGMAGVSGVGSSDPWFTGVQTDLMLACHVRLQVILQRRVHVQDCAGVRPMQPAPDLSMPAGPSRNLSTIPNH